jgi:DNA-binding protein H-NS
MNIDTLSIEDLADLRDKVIATLSDRVSARQKELQAEIDRVGSLTSSDKQKPSTARPKRPVKYRDGSLEWSGLGSKPAWVVAKGDTLESYRV